MGRWTKTESTDELITEFYKLAYNGLFGKLLNLASETVILELVRLKCMPILLYGLESCQLSNADLRSLDFTFNRLFMKLFKTKSIDVVKACQSFIGSEVPSCVLKRKTDKFILRFNCVDNTFCIFLQLDLMSVRNILFSLVKLVLCSCCFLYCSLFLRDVW